MIAINELTITNSLVYSINNMLSNLLSSLNDNIEELLDKLVFVDSNITKTLQIVIHSNSNLGIHLICNALIYGLLLYYAILYLLSHITYSQVERPAQFLFKLLLCGIALNFSEYLCSALISLCSSISSAICEMGNLLFGFDVSFSGLIHDVFPNDYFKTNSFSLFSFDGLVKSSMSFGLFSLTVSYAIRYIMIKVMLLIAPFAILSLASSKTSNFFRSWFRNFLAMLLLQVFIAMILLVCFVVNSKDANIISKSMMHIGMLYTLFKANSFIKELFGGFSLDIGAEMSTFSSLFRGGVVK